MDTHPCLRTEWKQEPSSQESAQRRTHSVLEAAAENLRARELPLQCCFMLNQSRQPRAADGSVREPIRDFNFSSSHVFKRNR